MEFSPAPFFSVVIPLYNRRELVGAALASVFEQSCPDFEVIVVDDGSTDQPADVLTRFSDPRLQLIQQENRGGSAARNAGIERARGQYIAFLDSDDMFMPHKLERMKVAIEAHAAEVYFSATQVERGDNTQMVKPSRPPRADERIDAYIFCAVEVIQTSTLVVKAALARQVRFMDGLAKGQDLDFVIRLAAAGARFHMVNEVLACWRDVTSAGRVSHTRNAAALEAWLAAHRSLLSPAAYRGFRANILSYDLAPLHPLTATLDILHALLQRDITLKRALHSLARAFLPTAHFRRLANWHLRGRA